MEGRLTLLFRGSQWAGGRMGIRAKSVNLDSRVCVLSISQGRPVFDKRVWNDRKQCTYRNTPGEPNDKGQASLNRKRKHFGS